MNDEAYRIFALTPRAGRHRPAVRRRASASGPTSCGSCRRVRADDAAEPRRVAAEGPRPRDRLHAVAGDDDDAGVPIGAVMFFKDLTQVEQLEERERLRDRLAALGEMAAGIAHELKNPLAGIEVMAGLLRRQVPTRPTRSRCSPTSSAKRSWPTRSSSRCWSSSGRFGCRSSTRRSPTCCTRRSRWPRAKRARGEHRGDDRRADRTCRRSTATSTSCVRCSRTC